MKISRTYGPDELLMNPEIRHKMEERDLLIMEDEVQALKLTVSSLETQLNEQVYIYNQNRGKATKRLSRG